jgi:hypothetical protein
MLTRRMRQDRGEVLFTIAADAATYDVMILLGELDPACAGDSEAVRAGLGRLLRRGVEALLREERKKM